MKEIVVNIERKVNKITFENFYVRIFWRRIRFYDSQNHIWSIWCVHHENRQICHHVATETASIPVVDQKIAKNQLQNRCLRTLKYRMAKKNAIDVWDTECRRTPGSKAAWHTPLFMLVISLWLMNMLKKQKIYMLV